MWGRGIGKPQEKPKVRLQQGRKRYERKVPNSHIMSSNMTVWEEYWWLATGEHWYGCPTGRNYGTICSCENKSDIRINLIKQQACIQKRDSVFECIGESNGQEHGSQSWIWSTSVSFIEHCHMIVDTSAGQLTIGTTFWISFCDELRRHNIVFVKVPLYLQVFIRQQQACAVNLQWEVCFWLHYICADKRHGVKCCCWKGKYFPSCQSRF